MKINKLNFLAVFLAVYMTSVGFLFAATASDFLDPSSGRKRDRTVREALLPEIRLIPDTEVSLATLATQNGDVAQFRTEELKESKKPEVLKRFKEHLLNGLLFTPEDMLLLEGALDSNLSASTKKIMQVQEYLSRRYLGICEKLIDNPRNVAMNPSHVNYKSNCQNFESLRETYIQMAKRKALEWVGKAYEQNSSDAQKRLGYMLYRGFVKHNSNVEQELNAVQQAVCLWRLSADQDDAEAQYLMGFSCENGLGEIRKDLPGALSWYTKSARNGDEKSKLRLKRLLPASNFLSVF